MRLSLSGLAAMTLVGLAVNASPVDKRQTESSTGLAHNGTCTTLKERKEWRALTDNEKRSYLDAVLCLKKTPPPEGNTFSGVKSLYDAFQAEHSAHALTIHWSGSFLPYHRLFLSAYEQQLADKCGYYGGQPYWDWSIDTDRGSLEDSELWDDELGFGGNGIFVPPEERPLPPPRFESPFLPPPVVRTPAEQRANMFIGTGGGCVQTGPFSEKAGFSVSIGPGNSTDFAPHCLKRNFDFNALLAGNSSGIAEVLRQPNFVQMHYVAEGHLEGKPTIHGSGHGAVGEEMSNVFSSPGDPVFYAHHAMLDRVWWLWQEQDLPTRLHEVGGNAVSFDFNSTSAPNVTVDTTIDLGVLHGPTRLGDLLDSRAAPWCFVYSS